MSDRKALHSRGRTTEDSSSGLRVSLRVTTACRSREEDPAVGEARAARSCDRARFAQGLERDLSVGRPGNPQKVRFAQPTQAQRWSLELPSAGRTEVFLGV